MAGGGNKGSGRPAKKKSPSKGTGGNVRRGLEGKGATPPAHMRHWHKDKARTERIDREEKGGGSSSARPSISSRTTVRTRRSEDAPEYIGGRNPVVEALRAGVPASTLYVAMRIDNDDRVRESIRLAANNGIAMLEVGRDKLDRITEGAIHQGMALQIPAYDYAHPEDLVRIAQDAGEAP